MNYRPYPDVDRALAQLERHRAADPVRAWLDRLTAPVQLTAWQRAWLNSTVAGTWPKRSGRTALTAAIVDQAVKDGHHVHIAGREGMIRFRASEMDNAYALGARLCPGCGHGLHPSGTECEAAVDHGPKRWHRCLCLAMAGASISCPPQMNCQGGTLGYADIVHLREGGILRGADGVTITAAALAERPTIVLARVVRTCTAVPSQWNAWTVAGQYLYLRYRSGIGTVDAYDSTDCEQWTHVPDGAVARFDTGDRLDGEMTLAQFCQHTGIEVADGAEVTGE